MDTRSKLATACAVFLLFSFVAMVVVLLRATDPPASNAIPQHTHSTPTNFKGPDYSEGLVTEYHEESGYPLPLGVFTIVVDGVEYHVQEPYGSLPTPIKPGYYQVDTKSIGVGIVAVFLQWQPTPDVVSGFIISERLVAPRK